MKTRVIDNMTKQDIEDHFMNNFDCYADCIDVIPSMTKDRYLKCITELLKDVE